VEGFKENTFFHQQDNWNLNNFDFAKLKFQIALLSTAFPSLGKVIASDVGEKIPLQ